MQTSAPGLSSRALAQPNSRRYFFAAMVSSEAKALGASAALYTPRSFFLASARKIRQRIESNNDIRNAFDAITYSKGASVIRMFEHWVGEDRFRTAIRGYIRAHAWGNADAGDFLAALRTLGPEVATQMRRSTRSVPPMSGSWTPARVD